MFESLHLEKTKIAELSQCSVIYYLNLKFKAMAMIDDNGRELNDIMVAFLFFSVGMKGRFVQWFKRENIDEKLKTI